MGFTLKIDKIIDLVLAANTSYIYCKNRQIIDPILVTNACVCVCVCLRTRAYFSLFPGKKYLTKQANKQQYYKTKDSYIAFVVLRLHRQLKVVPDATDKKALAFQEMLPYVFMRVDRRHGAANDAARCTAAGTLHRQRADSQTSGRIGGSAHT